MDVVDPCLVVVSIGGREEDPPSFDEPCRIVALDGPQDGWALLSDECLDQLPHFLAFVGRHLPQLL